MNGYYDGYNTCSNESDGSGEGTNSGDCYDKGYQDGLNEPFNQDTYSECSTTIDNLYYSGFVDGCQAVNPNLTELDCEGYTDE